MRPLTLTGLFVLCALPVLAMPPKEGKSDLDKFQGEWEVVAIEQQGQKIDMPATWTNKAEKYTFDLDGAVEDGTVKLQADKKPAQIDLDIKTGNCADKKQLGIYEFKDGRLIICLGQPDEKPKEEGRPTKFSTKDGGGFFMITLKPKKK